MRAGSRSIIRLLSLTCAASLALGGGTVDPAWAQMPDAAQMNGMAIPAAELPAGTVTVRVVRQALGNNVPGQTVTVTTGSASREARTDDQGRAEFPNLQPGVEGRAEVVVDGERLVSRPFVVPAAGGLRVILVAGLGTAGPPPAPAAAPTGPAVKGTVVLGGETRVLMEFRDDRLQVFYLLDVVNRAQDAVDIGGPLILQLPTGAGGAATMEGSSPSATVNGDVVTIQGPFAPGTTSVQVAFALNYTSSDIDLEQTWPVALEQVTVGIERLGAVGITSPQFSDTRDVRAGDGTPFMIANGPGLPAGGTLTLHLTDLPVHSPVPRYMTLTLAGALLAFGTWLAFGRRLSDDEVQKKLAHRRDTLLGELAQLEERRRHGTLDARQHARHQKLLAELEQIYGELDQVA
jgi:hypothetical protein